MTAPAPRNPTALPDQPLSPADVDRWILQALPVGVVVHGDDGRIIRCNVAAERTLGITESQMMGRTPTDPLWRVVHEDGSDFPGESHPAMVALRTGDPVVDVVMGVHKPDGSLTWINVNAIPVVVGAPGSVPAVIVTFSDITEQVRLRELASEAEQRYRLLAENASDVVVQISDEGIIEWISPSVTRLLGWTPEDWIGRSSLEIVVPEDVGLVLAGREAVRSGRAPQFRARVLRRDGGSLWVESRAHWAVPRADGPPARIASWRDVSEQVQLQERLHDETEQFRMLAENASDLVFVTGADHRVSWVAPNVTKVLGYTPAEFVGLRIAELLRPEYRDATDEQRAAFYAGHDVAPHEGYLFELRTRNGDYRWMSGSTRILTDAQGNPSGAVAGLRDVTELVQANHRRQAVLDTMLDFHALVSAVRDEAGVIVDVVIDDLNDVACRLFDCARSEILGTSLLVLFPSAGVQIRTWCDQVLTTGVPLRLDHELIQGPVHAEPRWIDLRAVKVDDRVSATWRDVTEDYELRLQLEESEARYRLLAENATDVVVHLRDGLVSWVSPSLRTVLGWEPEQWLGKDAADFVHADDRAGLHRVADAIGNGATLSYRARLLATDGTYHWVEGRGQPFVGADGRQDGRITSIRVVDEEVAAHEALRRRATHDGLTDLLTRGEVIDRLTAILSHPPRGGARTAIAFCDIDGFKAVNDRYGHRGGDEALRVLARRIRAVVRESDLVARFGGDEILVVLDAVPDESDVRAIAEKIREAALLPIPVDGGAVTVTLSIGIAFASRDDTLDALVARADDAMYAAKTSGKNQVIKIPTPDR